MELIDILKTCSKSEFQKLIKELSSSGLGIDPTIKLKEERFGNRYIRTITVPANFVLVGKHHKHMSHWVLLFGEMVTRTESEDEATTVTDSGAGINHINDIRIGITTRMTKWACLHTIPSHVLPGQEEDWVLSVQEVETA